jgi:hypothetical protein
MTKILRDLRVVVLSDLCCLLRATTQTVIMYSKVTTYVTTFATAVYTVLYVDYKDAPSGREHCFADLQRRHKRWIDRTIYGISGKNAVDEPTKEHKKAGITEIAAEKS